MTHIPNSHSRVISFLGILIIVAFGIVSILGSGGGDGDGDSSTSAQPLAYDGNTDPAIITIDNATTILSSVLFDNMAGDAIPIGVATSSTAQLSDIMTLVDDMARLFATLPADVVISDNMQAPVGWEELLVPQPLANCPPPV